MSNRDAVSAPTRTAINAALREALGHNGAECRVRIHTDGMVERYGTRIVTDRSQDFWGFVGQRRALLVEYGYQVRAALGLPTMRDDISDTDLWALTAALIAR